MTSVHRIFLSVLAVLALVYRADAQPPTPMPVMQLDLGPSVAEIAAARRLSLSIASPIQVRDALRLLVRGTRFSLMVDPAVRGTFAGNLKDVTLREALEAVLRPRRLAYTIAGTVIRVYPRRTESRFFTIDFVNVRRTWQRTLQQGDGASFSSAAGGDPFEDVQRSVETLLSPDGRAYVDRRAGIISVTDYADQLDRVATYVETLLSRSLRQVRLQARFIDANANTTIVLPDLIGLNNEPVVMRSSEPDGATLALTIVPEVESSDVIQLSVSPSWSDRTARAGTSDVIVRVRNGGTIAVPVASGITVQLTATVIAGGTQ
jgi:hypothetical protein